MLDFFRTYTGTEQLSEANTLHFVVNKLISEVRTMTIVKVLAVEFPDGQNIYGTVDLQPLINRVDFDGFTQSMTPIYNVPFIRLQGTSNSAIILNPKIGDIGIAIVCDRDNDAVLSTKKQANPLSNRANSLADSVYIGGILNAKPTQYVEFTDDAINITSPNNINFKANAVNIKSPTVTIKAENLSITAETSITGNLSVSGNISSAGDVSDSIGKLSDLRSSYNSHKHRVGGVETGSGSVTSDTPQN